MSNCNYRKSRPMLVDLLRSDTVSSTKVLVQVKFPTAAIDAEEFDQQQPDWIKVELVPGVAA